LGVEVDASCDSFAQAGEIAVGDGSKCELGTIVA
jgi:hypothetical protein